MRASVLAVWHRFSEPLEGRVYCMYLDTKGLVTTGVGNLIDSMAAALTLPWKRPSGDLASPAEIASAWQVVKAHQEYAPYGGGHRVWRELTALRLTPEDIDALVRRHLASDEAHLRTRVTTYDELPADAQLALHSWAWAVGAAAHYPRLIDALNDLDFERASVECFVNPNVGTIIERNRRNKQLFVNAHRVQAFHFDPDQVYWPDDLSGAVRAAETVPAVDNPVSEDDGGAARHEATLDAIDEAAKDRGE